jgi:uncharacterized protein (DUF1015 family)
LSLAPRRVGDPASARAFARPYRGVPQRLETWCKRGLAHRDDEPAVYLHEYSDSGLTVRGLVGCLDLSHPAHTAAQRQVLPHEGVHPRQVTELAARMATMRLNPAPILLVHRGPETIREVSRKVRTGSPDREYVDHAGQQHRVWSVRDPDHLEVVNRGLAEARLLVADGHHRYAAYVALQRREQQAAYRCGLAMVIDHDETPMFLGAIHRVIHGPRIGELLDAAAAAGAEVTRIDEAEAVAALAPDTLVLCDGASWATGLPKKPSRITFAHSVAQAMEQTRPGKVTAALLPAVDLDVVVDGVRTGVLLPEKATSFQPKPSLGSFIRLLDE